MAITKAWATGNNSSTDSTSITTATFDSTGYTHLVVFTKHEGATTTITPSDNKSSTGWTSHTKQGNGVSDSWGQFHSVTIGSPGTGHTVTMTVAASRPYKSVLVWRVNANSGAISLVSQTTATGSSTTPDAGTLSNAGADSVVSFFGVAEYAASTYTPGTGWTEDYDPNGTPANYTYGASRGAETTTSIDPTCTGGSQDWAACAVMFKEGSSGVSISSGLGQLTLTGLAPTLSASDYKTASPGLGQLTLTGYAPTLSASGSISISPALGQLTITGYAPSQTLTVGSPGVASLVLTGYAPTVNIAVAVSSGLGQLTLTGYAPTVAATANQFAAPSLGQLAITGYAPLVAASGSYSLESGLGQLTLTGLVPSLTATDHKSVSAGLGQLSLSGFAPTLEIGGLSASISAGLGQLTITGFAPDVVNSGDRRNQGAGKKKQRRRKYTVEVEGVEYSVESPEEAEAVLAKAREIAEERVDTVIERAQRATRRPTRKVLADARKALQTPRIEAPSELAEQAQAVLAEIQSLYESTLRTIEIGALMRRAEEEDDEEAILLLL